MGRDSDDIGGIHDRLREQEAARLPYTKPNGDEQGGGDIYTWPGDDQPRPTEQGIDSIYVPPDGGGDESSA